MNFIKLAITLYSFLDDYIEIAYFYYKYFSYSAFGSYNPTC